MSYTIVAEPLTQRSIAFGSIVAGYTIIGTAFDHPIRILDVINQTDALVQFSFDGVIDHFVLPGNSFRILDFCSNKSGDPGLFIPKGKALYVKRIAIPTSGSVYVSAYTGRGDSA